MRLLWILLLTGTAATAARADYWHDAWLDPALLEADTLQGGSGYVRVPAPQSLASGLLLADLHAYRAGVGRGFPYGVEAGMQMDLDGLDQDPTWQSVPKRELFYLRWSPLNVERLGIGLSMGWEGVGLGDLGFNVANIPPADNLERHYAVLGGPLPDLPMASLAAGYGGGARGSGAFAALAVAPFSGAAALLEYDHGTDLGLRMMLSTQIKADLSISDIQSIDWGQPFDLVLTNNVRFGISYAEVWP